MKIDTSSIAIRSWVEAWSDKMYSWALYKTSSKETAEDLVQETFIVAFQSFDKFKGKSEPKTWLFSILNNKIADHFRKVYRQTVVNESDRNPEAGNNFLDIVISYDKFFVILVCNVKLIKRYHYTILVSLQCTSQFRIIQPIAI